MVQSTSLIVAAATASTILYSAVPVFGASIPVRRDGLSELSARESDNAGKPNKAAKKAAKKWEKKYRKLLCKSLALKSTVRELRKAKYDMLGLIEFFITKAPTAEKSKLLGRIEKLLNGQHPVRHTKKKGSKKSDSQNSGSDSDYQTDSNSTDTSDGAAKDPAVDKKAKDKKFKLSARDFDEEELSARDLEAGDLFTRHFDDDELVARELYDMSEVEARELLESLEARDFDELDARDFDEDLYERSGSLADLD